MYMRIIYVCITMCTCIGSYRKPHYICFPRPRRKTSKARRPYRKTAKARCPPDCCGGRCAAVSSVPPRPERPPKKAPRQATCAAGKTWSKCQVKVCGNFTKLGRMCSYHGGLLGSNGACIDFCLPGFTMGPMYLRMR